MSKQILPKKAFDTEYSTMWSKEHRFLQAKGIECTFIKNTRDYNVPVYKYKKTPELFSALFEFYTQVEKEKGLKVFYKNDEPEFLECP